MKHGHQPTNSLPAERRTPPSGGSGVTDGSMFPPYRDLSEADRQRLEEVFEQAVREGFYNPSDLLNLGDRYCKQATKYSVVLSYLTEKYVPRTSGPGLHEMKVTDATGTQNPAL